MPTKFKFRLKVDWKEDRKLRNELRVTTGLLKAIPVMQTGEMVIKTETDD